MPVTNAFDTIRYAVRRLRLTPVFTVTAMLTLALGIGGTTAIFTLIDAVMLRSLPVGDPSRLYRIGEGDNCCVQGGPQERWGMFSWPLVQLLASQTPEFEQITAFQAGGNRLSVRREGDNESARPLRTEYVTGNYFETLGVRAAGGRLLSPDDDKDASPPVAVLSYNAWQSTYGGDPAVVGSTFAIEGHPFTIVGVGAPGFYGDTLRANPPELWIPLHQEPLIAGNASLLRQPVSAWLRVIGRLRPGATIEGMGPRLTGTLRHWIQYDSGYPANWMPEIVRTLPQQVINITPAGSGVAEMKEEYGDSLRLLLVVCGLVLLIACANVANLLLARAAAGRTQTAVRLAVGASRRQIVLQALTESVLLAIAGGIAGLAVAAAAAKLLLSLAFRNATFLPVSTTPSWLVLGFAFSLALVTGIVFGAAPAWAATRTNPVDALRGAGRTTREDSSFTRRTLLIVQATISVVLVAGATMLARSLDKLESQDFGYQVRNRIVVSMNRPPATYTPEKLSSLYRALEERLNRIPGVEGSGLALYNPLTDNWGELVLVQGHPEPRPGEQAGASWDRVSTSYLSNLGVSTLRGRGFTPADNETSEHVAVVNEAFVKRFFKAGEEPLGQHFGIDIPENAGTYRIVGIVRDAKFAGFQLDRPARPMFYVPLTQTVHYANDLINRIETSSHFIGGMMLVTNASPAAMEPMLKKALAEVDPNLTITTVRSMEQAVQNSFNQERAVATLAGLFGIVALILAGVGLYGVTAYTVAQRTNEFGIRMALGADRVRVLTLVLRGAFMRVAVGLLLGIPLSIGAGRMIASQLYNVSFWDPSALAIATGALALSAFVAAVIPATRAAGLSPMRALRIE
jgi:predicted permease